MPDSLRKIEKEIVACRACPRLVLHREKVAREKRRAYIHQAYWGKPVPGFGDPAARVVLVGLAPGAHGSNRTGRQFTGDASGDFLYPTLHRFGFSSEPLATARNDGLRLENAYITAAARCAPPGNKPTREELARCHGYLVRELRLLGRARVLVALGRHGFEAILSALPALGLTLAEPERRKPPFGHGVAHELAPGPLTLLCSYHPSRQNTQTGKLTQRMFDAVFRTARNLAANA